jgi:DNA repair protein RadC
MKKQKQTEMSLEVMFQIPPTIPPVSWAEARVDYKRGPIVGSPSDATEYFKKFIGGKDTEAFLCLFLDHRNHVLDCICNPGTVDHTAVYPREIFKKAFELNASGLILSHNHPGGSLEASEGDRQLTRQLTTAGRALGITIHDHVIVTHEGHFSFRQAGLLA